MACKCNAGLGNTGLPSCAPIASVTKKIIFVPTYKADGTRNYIDTTVTLDPAYLSAAINNSDVNERWLPMPYFENVVNERAESSFEEAPSGRRSFIKKGTRTLTGEIWGKEAQPQLISRIEKSRCVDVSIFIIDIEGNIIGSGDVTDTGKLYPIRLDSQSVDATLMYATDSTQQKIMVTMSFDDIEKDSDLYMLIDGEDFTFDALDSEGLLDIYSSYSSITTTGFVADLYTAYGSLKDLVVDSGLVAGDFTLYNETSASSVVITSVTESPDGTYTFVIPAQTSADVLTLTPSKTGRDYTEVIANQIVIP